MIRGQFLMTVLQITVVVIWLIDTKQNLDDVNLLLRNKRRRQKLN